MDAEVKLCDCLCLGWVQWLAGRRLRRRGRPWRLLCCASGWRRHRLWRYGRPGQVLWCACAWRSWLWCCSRPVSGWRRRLWLGLLRLRRFGRAPLHAVVEDACVAVPCWVGAVGVATAVGPVVGPPRAIPGCPAAVC